MLAYIYYLDKNPRWVTGGNGYEDFPEDFQICDQLVDCPCGYGGATKLSLIIPLLDFDILM